MATIIHESDSNGLGNWAWAGCTKSPMPCPNGARFDWFLQYFKMN